MKKAPILSEEIIQSIINLMTDQFAFFKNAFMNNEHLINWLNRPENKEHKTAIEELGRLIANTLGTGEKLEQFLDAFKNKQAFVSFLNDHPALVPAMSPVIVQILKAAEKWTSEQRVRTNVPQVHDLAIVASQYLPKALENLLKLKKLFIKAGDVDFDGFVSLFFYDNMPKRLSDDPDDRDVILHNFKVDVMNADLRAIYDFLRVNCLKKDDVFEVAARALIKPEFQQGNRESPLEFQRRTKAFPKYLISIEKFIKNAGQFGVAIRDQLRNVTREKKEALKERDQRLKVPNADKIAINDQYDVKMLEISSKEDDLRAQMKEVDSILDYYRENVGKQDYFAMHNRKPNFFFKSLNPRHDYLDVMDLQSSCGRFAAGMNLHENLFSHRFDLLQKLGVQNLPGSLRDINDYIKVNQAYSAHVKQSARFIKALRLLQNLLKEGSFRENFTPETLRVFQIMIDSLPQSDRGGIIEIDINNVEHVRALNTAYQAISPLCFIENYPLIEDVHTMTDSLSNEEFKRYEIYLYHDGKEIIDDHFHVDNLDNLLQVHHAFHVLKNSNEIRPLFLEYPKYIGLIQRLINDESFKSYFKPETVLKIQQCLQALPRENDGTSVELDINNPSHVRMLVELHSLCKIDRYALIDDVRLLRDYLSEDEFANFSYNSTVDDKEILHDNFSVTNLVNLFRIHHLFDLLSNSKDIKPILNELLEESHRQRSLQEEVDTSVKDMQQEKKPIQQYTTTPLSEQDKLTLQAQQQGLKNSTNVSDEYQSLAKRK